MLHVSLNSSYFVQNYKAATVFGFVKNYGVEKFCVFLPSCAEFCPFSVRLGLILHASFLPAGFHFLIIWVPCLAYF